MKDTLTILYDIRSREEWQRILDSVSRELGLPSAITDTKNRVLQTAGQRNPLCSKIRSNPEAASLICGQAHQYMAEQAREKMDLVIDYCDAGMLKIVIPLFSDTVFAGTLTACGALVDGQEIEAFLIEKSTELNQDEIEALTRQVPEGDMSKISGVARIIHCRIHDKPFKPVIRK